MADEWDAKAREAVRIVKQTVSSVSVGMLAAEYREAYQRGRNEADTAAERRGIERAAKVADQHADKIMEQAEVDHDEERYDAYEEMECQATAISEVADAIRALAPPMADAGPTEPAGASDKGALRS